MSTSTPPRLQSIKWSLTATAVLGTATALTAGVAVAGPEAYVHEKRVISSQFALAADDTDAVVGVYGVGPIFWTAELLGLTPDNLIDVALGLIGDIDLGEIGDIIDLLGAVDVDIKGPLPSDVYDAVNNLNYTGTDSILAIVQQVTGLSGFAWTITQAILRPILDSSIVANQRRAVLLSDNLGGLTTALAYRQMIDAVVNDAPDWAEGITAQLLLNFNSPSRPGGGLAALLTPFTNLAGLNLSMPDAGSYVNADATKILNTTIVDLAYAYSLMSDAPTTFSGIAWANALVGGLLPTYVIPDELDLANTNVDELGGDLAAALPDILLQFVDPTGGQGTATLGAIGYLLDLLGLDADGVVGESYYLTYDSGNLPLLEPLEVIPRLVNLIPGFHLSTALTDSVQEALQMMVNMGYQDVDPETLQRTYEQGGEQAYIYHSALTPTQQLDATNLIVNTLITGIQENALTPSQWRTEIAGFDLTPLFDNALTRPVATALRQALEVVRDVYNAVYDATEPALKRVTGVLDDVNERITTGLDRTFKPGEPEADSPAEASNTAPTTLASVTSLPKNPHEVRTRTLAVAAQDVGGAVFDTAEESADPVAEGLPSKAETSTRSGRTAKNTTTSSTRDTAPDAADGTNHARKAPVAKKSPSTKKQAAAKKQSAAKKQRAAA